MKDLTCRLYVDGSANLEELATLLLQIVDGKRVGRTISTSSFEIDLEKSEDFDPIRSNEVDGFLFWSMGAYLEPLSNSISEKSYIVAVSTLIKEMRERGLRVVASCDFEDDIAQLTGWNWSEKTPFHPTLP